MSSTACTKKVHDPITALPDCEYRSKLLSLESYGHSLEPVTDTNIVAS